MRLRTKILLSYIILIGIISSGAYVIIDFFAINRLTRDHLVAAQEGVGNMSRLNSVLAKKTLNDLGETILELTAQRDADRAAIYLSSKGENYWKDYAKLRQDKQFRAIVSHQIYAYDRVAGYVDCLDRQGLAIIHPNKDVEGRNYRDWTKTYPEMWQLVEKSFTKNYVCGHYRFVDVKGKTEEKFMVICHIPNTGLSLAAAVTINQFFDPIHHEIQSAEVKMTDLVNRRIQASSVDSSRKIKFWSLPLIAFVVLICTIFALWFSSSITQPLIRLINGVRSIGKGNFAVTIPEEGSYESSQLAHTFNQLGRQLAEYTENLKNEAAARESVESEIKIARTIQESLLPKEFPGGEWFDLAALLNPAREVAGDFYDCFERNGRLYMIIGDVSGKGVPAAFFMAVVRTMLRDICHSETDPGRVLTLANRHLCKENETCMFVTLFLAVYDIQNGSMLYANGGHNELISIAADNVKITNFGITGDMALGIIPETEYRTAAHQVNAGETIVFYTDGVTEAISPQQVLYGIDRLHELIGANATSADTMTLCRKISDDVVAYEQGARFDDITVMAFHRKA